MLYYYRPGIVIPGHNDVWSLHTFFVHGPSLPLVSNSLSLSNRNHINLTSSLHFSHFG